MSRQHVDHANIVQFADDRVNLKREDACELREQANRLHDSPTCTLPTSIAITCANTHVTRRLPEGQTD